MLGCVAASIALGIYFQLLAVGLGGGIGSFVIGIPCILHSMYGLGYVDKALNVRKLKRILKSHSNDRIKIKFDSYHNCIIFEIPKEDPKVTNTSSAYKTSEKYTLQTKKVPEPSAPSNDMIQDDSIVFDGPSVEEASTIENMQFKYFSNDPTNI